MAYPRHRALKGAGTPLEQRVVRRLISPIAAGLSIVLAVARLQPNQAGRPIHPLKGFRQRCHRPPQRTIAPDRGTEGFVRRGGCGSAAEHGIGVHCTAADGSVCSRYVEFKRPHLLPFRQSGFFCGHDRGHQPNPRAAGPLRRHGGRFRCQAGAGRLLGRPDRSDGGAGRPGGQVRRRSGQFGGGSLPERLQLVRRRIGLPHPPAGFQRCGRCDTAAGQQLRHRGQP